MKKYILRLSEAIKNDRFSFKNLGRRTWYGRTIYVGLLFCSYGQIGYSINIEGLKGAIHYDYEFKQLTLNDYGGPKLDLWDDEDLERLDDYIKD